MAREYNKTTKDVLFYFLATGVITIACTSPFFWQSLIKDIFRNRKYIKKEIDKIINERKIVRALERLRKNRLIIISEKDGKFTVELTEKGKKKVQEIQFLDMKIEKPPFWDEKWRVVIFDIPKNKNRARDALREKLQEMKFYQLQKSVWVCPYFCQKEIQLLCELFDIFPYVNIVEANNIYNDIALRKYFKLL